MAKHAAATKLMSADVPPLKRNETLADRLNRHILQTLQELRTTTEAAEDPGIEDEFEFEIFGNTGPRPPSVKKKK